VHVATAIITAPADVATYTEIFTELEETTSYGEEACKAPCSHRRQLHAAIALVAEGR
jgi:hypothetical protein